MNGHTARIIIARSWINVTRTLKNKYLCKFANGFICPFQCFIINDIVTNAVLDFATHAQPVRKTKNYRENLFLKTAEGNPLIDRAYQMALSA